MQVAIKESIEKVPGGMMVVPLLLGSLIVTFFPDTPKFFGSFTGALFTGALPILAVFYVCMGASIDIKATPYIVKKGGSLFATKIAAGIFFGIVLGRLLGEAPISSGMFAGLSTLAVVAAMNDTNGGLYMALMGQYGKPRDVGAYSIMSLESGPFLTMVTLGVAGLSAFPWQTLVGSILPLAFGMLIGNLDHKMREFLGRAVPVMIPFFAFALGAGLDLQKVWQAGLLGLGMGVAVVGITGILLFFADRATGGTGVAGVAAASTAGNAAAVPAIVAASNPVYAEAAKSATILVAACVVVTAILVPFVTAWTAQKFGSNADLPDDEEGATPESELIMAGRWLILADDLTGAADCAIAFAKNGLETQVFWGEGLGSDATVLSVDADSRRFSANDAAARQLKAQAAHWRPGMRLYKKIDSTIRGQPAAELAAQLKALGSRAPLAVMAPAFPATGRVTRDGRVVVNDQPLEATPLWARDHTYASAFLPEVLASASLSAEVIDLATVRTGRDAALARMRDAQGRGIAAVVCDCAAESDLAIVADASLALDDAVWVGSAGLAAALAKLVAPAMPAPPPKATRSGAVLTVVGSLAEASRLQAKTLTGSGRVTHLVIAPDTLAAGSQASRWQDIAKSLSVSLRDGRDVLLEIGLSEKPDLARGAALAAALAQLVEQVAPAIGAMIATGGETACALLSRLGVHGISLIDEVEPGVPFGISLGARSIPVVTKAGAFGDAHTLRRCLDRLKDIPAAR